MSSIIKSRYIKQGSVVELQDRMWCTYVDEAEDPELIDEELEIEIIEEPQIDYNALYEEALKAKEAILVQAREQAKQIIEEATQKAISLETNATKRVQEMIEETTLYTEEKVISADKCAEEIVKQAYETKQEILKSIEPEVVEVIETLVGHILHEEVARSNKWIAYTIKKMLVKEKILGGLTVYLSPYVMESITEEEKMELNVIKNEINLSVDEELNDTTCIVETTEGSILYDISEGIDKILGELHTLKQLKVEAKYDELTRV